MAHWLTLASATLVAIVAGLALATREDTPDASPALTSVAVVSVPQNSARGSTSDLNPTPPSGESAASKATPPEIVTAHLASAYPLLRNAALRCSGQQCIVTGRILPMQAQADLDRRQEMLLGGLAAVLAQDGYRLAAPLELKEVDENVFVLETPVVEFAS